MVIAVDFGDVGGTGQDGLPVLGIGNAQCIEDANSVSILVLLGVALVVDVTHGATRVTDTWP